MKICVIRCKSYAQRVVDIQQVIVQVSRNKDEKSFEQLFFYFYPQLFRLAYTYLKQAEEAEEIVSDVFVRLWEKREKLEEIRNLEIYLIVATKNHSLNRIKQLQRAFFTDLNEINAAQLSNLEDPEQQMLTRELASLIDEAVHSLPDQCRTIFQMVRLDGLKQREVAKKMNLSPRTVENQVGIALKKIAVRLAAHFKSGTTKKQKKIGIGTLTLILLPFSVLFYTG